MEVIRAGALACMHAALCAALHAGMSLQWRLPGGSAARIRHSSTEALSMHPFMLCRDHQCAPIHPSACMQCDCTDPLCLQSPARRPVRASAPLRCGTHVPRHASQERRRAQVPDVRQPLLRALQGERLGWQPVLQGVLQAQVRCAVLQGRLRPHANTHVRASPTSFRCIPMHPKTKAMLALDAVAS